MKKIISIVVTMAVLVGMILPFQTVHGEDNFDYYVGTGISDITGPSWEMVTMGYADSNHTLEGMHMRLWARSFVVQDKQNGQKVAFVSADLGQLFHSIKQGVVAELNKRGYKDYNYSNVMLSATHDHSGPGGYSYEGMYNISTWGFVEQSYNAIVKGITESIIKADRNKEKGYLEVATGTLKGISANRSLEAYDKNKKSLLDQYEDNVDTSMTVLNLKNTKGNLLGIFNWFAVHGVSMSQKNHLVSGDNKGTAAYLYEQSMGTDYTKDRTFVAGFCQANCGDITPNVNLDGTGLGKDDFQSSLIAGSRQANKVRELSRNAKRVTGSLDFRHQFIDMRYKKIAPQYADGQERATYPAAMGYSFAAGTEDGRTGLPFFEGMTQDKYTIDGSANFFKMAQGIMTLVPKFGEMSGTNYPQLWKEHYPKPVLFAPSMVTPDPWTPQIIPMQLFKIGNFALTAVPAEFTSMAGRILKSEVKKTLDQGTGQDNVVALAGLANSYSSYVTTIEEYDAQHYEGASTQFGRYTLAQYKQVFDQMATSILKHTPLAPGPTPKDLSGEQKTLQTGVIFDNVPPFTNFGDMHLNAKDSYKTGDTVDVEFWSGHPKNDLRTGIGYIQVQRFENGQWKTIAHDWDLSTRLYWIRENTVLGYSYAKVLWTIPYGTPAGRYRILHNGSYKTLLGDIYPYSGVTKEFNVK